MQSWRSHPESAHPGTERREGERQAALQDSSRQPRSQGARLWQLPEEVWWRVAVFLEPWQRPPLRRVCRASNAGLWHTPSLVGWRVQPDGAASDRVQLFDTRPMPRCAVTQVGVQDLDTGHPFDGEAWVGATLRPFTHTHTALLRTPHWRFVWERGPEGSWDLVLAESTHPAMPTTGAEHQCLARCSGLLRIPRTSNPFEPRSALGLAPKARQVCLCGPMGLPSRFVPSSVLQVLELRNTAPLTNYGEIQQANYPNLQRLVLHNARLSLQRGAFAASRQLRHLELHNCDFVGSSFLGQIQETFPCLEHLRYSGSGSDSVSMYYLNQWSSTSLRTLYIEAPFASHWATELSLGVVGTLPRLAELTLPQLPSCTKVVRLALPALRYLGTSPSTGGGGGSTKSLEAPRPQARGSVHLDLPLLVEADLSFLAPVCRQLHVAAPRAARVDLGALDATEELSGCLGRCCAVTMPRRLRATHPLHTQLVAMWAASGDTARAAELWCAWLAELAAALLHGLSDHARSRDTPALAACALECCHALLNSPPPCCVLEARLADSAQHTGTLASAARPAAGSLAAAVGALASALLAAAALDPGGAPTALAQAARPPGALDRW